MDMDPPKFPRAGAARLAPGAREGGDRPAPAPGWSPLVSIVTVVYRGAETLAETIASVAAQDYDGIEYIVIDGGSTDGTVELIEQNQRHISYWRSEPDGGIYDAMNKGIGLARGQLIKLLNADDLLCPGSVGRAAQAYRDGAAGGVIQSDLELIDERGAFIKVMRADRARNPFGGVVHPSWYVDRAVYERHGLYLPSFRVSADYELFARLQTRRVRFFHLDPPLVRFRAGGASSGFTGLAERYRVNRHYLGTAAALRFLALHGYVKVRGRIARAVFDEHALAAIQRRLSAASGLRSSSRSRPSR